MGVVIMIVYKRWYKSSKFSSLAQEWEGWYLFGVIPLYVRQRR
jgi:hypothetical protein